jgi:pimeloyl-ACP methyl ester carboxylesterase
VSSPAHPLLHTVRVGSGPTVLLVHGSAAEHTTWTIQLASPLKQRFTLLACDRRGTAASPLPPGPGWQPVEAHADDLAALVDEPVLAVGSSFGAVCVLELARRRPELLRGMILCEPPLPPDDDAPAVPDSLLGDLDALAAAQGGEAAAERFLRTVLGDPAYERMPKLFQARSKALWPQIRGDCHALGAYRVRYPELGAIRVPALLLGGERSAPYYRPTLDALAAALGDPRLEILPFAGHMMQADAFRRFNERLASFAAEVGLS